MARRHATQQEEAEINITPMLDMTFILLIFFIVTTSFVRPPGVQVNKPPAVTARTLHSSVLLAVTPSGQIWMNKRKITLNQVPGMVESALSQAPKGNVVIIADSDAPSGLVVRLMGQVKLGGATSIALGAKKEENGGGA